MPNPAIAPVAFYKTWIKVGSLDIPCLGGPTFNMPENFLTPAIIGNYWQFNYAPGLQQPIMELPLAVRDISTEVLSTTFLNHFFTRSNDVSHDTTEIAGGVTFYDGDVAGAVRLDGSKADSFTISCSKGEIVGMTARFCGTGITTVAVPTITAWNANRPLVYSDCNFDNASLQDVVYNFNLSFSNQHYPDMALNGTRSPAAWRAGMQTVGFNYRCQARAPIPADDSVISLILAGSNITRTLTLNRVQNNTRKNRSITAPQVMRQYSMQCTGGSGQAVPPLTYS